MKKIIKKDNKWFDDIAKKEFKGNVSKDLEVGDEFQRNGKTRKIKEKQVLENGYTIVISEEIGEVV